jgi:hypothetical protein
MKNTKKDITKLKYVKLNGVNNLSQIGEKITPQIASEETGTESAEIEMNKPTYKKFEETVAPQVEKNIMSKKIKKEENLDVKAEEKNISTKHLKPESVNFRLPKFLAERENQKKQISSLKNPQSNQSFIGSLPFTQENFSNNPNSFTTIFNKDNDKINGFQRVFRKSVIFLALQLLSFAAITFLIVSGLGFSFGSPSSTLVSLGLIAGSIILYAALTCIFYIIVADRSYIWVSLVLQSLFLIAVYAVMGLGLFSASTIVFAFLIFILSYFAYLEIEKIQVSTRFFSIGYITSEALKILSTVAILTICLGVFNLITVQTPKEFLSKNLINNESIYSTVVMGNSFPFNAINLNKIALSGEKYSINTENLVESGGKTVDLRTFLLRNVGLSGLLSENEKKDIKAGCDNIEEKECLNRINAEQDKKLKAFIKDEKSSYSNLNFGLDEVLDKTSFKLVLKDFYSNKIDDLNNQSATLNEISYFKNYKQFFDPVLPYIIQASIAILVFLFLSFFKFIFNIITSILIWLIWKIMLITGFAKIDVELVESEIVSI